MNVNLKISFVKYGLYTAGAVVLFQTFNRLVIYDKLNLDQYLTFVSLLFLGIGFGIKKQRIITKEIVKEVFIEKAHPETSDKKLTAKEFQILNLIAQGKSNKEMAAINSVELSTIKTHINNLYAKIGAKNRWEAAKWYIEISKTEV